MGKIIEHASFDEERALYGAYGLELTDCTFDGPADGESALKEASAIKADCCTFNLRYPLWHCRGVELYRCRLSENCRAALWYSEQVQITNSHLHGIKVLRECRGVKMRSSAIDSNECGWFCHDVNMGWCDVNSEYFMLRSDRLKFTGVNFAGKYGLQYLQDSEFDRCTFIGRDAFWHARNVTIKNSVLRGEYLGWYAENLRLENCRIESTQPLCYCQALQLINCEVVNSDLCFEKSWLDAVITTPVISIKNPRAGRIIVPAVGTIIQDDPNSAAQIITTGSPGV